jgi:ubiquinone/menaquinone biosynthesis C-methylase UbiE
MADAKQIYASDAERYEALISHEDYVGNIERALDEIARVDGLNVVDMGAGTGRLAVLLAARARSLSAFDISHHMLRVARDRLSRMGGRSMVAAADHRKIPLPADSADVVVSGWSVSYLAVWNPERWRAELDAWLPEALRVLRRGGHLILLESLGTGSESPLRLPHLEKVYDWLDSAGFESKWIRTDYRFDSVEQGAELAGFFFGEEMGRRVRAAGSEILPECTGIWWLQST